MRNRIGVVNSISEFTSIDRELDEDLDNEEDELKEED